MLKRILFSIFTISSFFVFNSCEEEELLEHRNFDLDLQDFVFFPVGSTWDYVKYHSEPDSFIYDRVKLVEIKENYVPSEYGDYLVKEREDIFWSSNDSALFSHFTREKMIENNGEPVVVFETQAKDFFFYSNMQEPGFEHPDFELTDFQGENLDIPNKYKYFGLVDVLTASDYGNLWSLIDPGSIIGFMQNLNNKIPGVPVIKRVGNGRFYNWVDNYWIEPDSLYSGYLTDELYQEAFLAQEVGTVIRLDRKENNIWILIDYDIPVVEE